MRSTGLRPETVDLRGSWECRASLKSSFVSNWLTRPRSLQKNFASGSARTARVLQRSGMLGMHNLAISRCQLGLTAPIGTLNQATIATAFGSHLASPLDLIMNWRRVELLRAY